MTLSALKFCDGSYLCFPAVSTYHSKIEQTRTGTMDRRRQQRVFVDLPVTIWGMDANSRPYTQPASLRTISGRGATLQGVDAQLKPGDTLDLQYEGAKAQFRVVWLGKPGTEMQGEVGLENLSADTQLWDIDPLRCAAATGRG
jgi:hypothetical protein